MLKSLLKAVGLLAILAWSGLAFAVGMGSINVTSALGRPLKAEIGLVSLDNADKSSITVRLASPSDFKNAGIDYPYTLPKLKFEVDTKADGTTYINLTTTQPVNEPYVSLLLELSWSSGKMLREYTFLLDPENFVAEQPKMAEVQPVEPVAPVAVASAEPAEIPPMVAEPAAVEATASIVPAPGLTAASEEQKTPEVMGAPAGVAPAAEVAAASAPDSAAVQSDVTPDMEAKDMAAEPASAPAASMDVAAAEKTAEAEKIAVKSGDSLSKIAAQVKPAEVSLERMIVALYHANSQEFDSKNMNRLRTGKILRMPESEGVSKITQAAAVKEIHAHVADWNTYRQKLAAAQGMAAEQAPKQVDAGKVTTAVSEKSPVTKEPAKEVLKLSKGEAPGDKQVAGASSKKEKQIAKQDDALAKEKQLQEEQKRVAELEKIKQSETKLVELKTQAVESVPVVAASAPVEAAVPVAKPKAMPVKTAAAPASPLDEMLEDPMYLGGAAAVLLGLGGLGFVLVRRSRNKGGKKKSELTKEFKIEPIGSATGSWAAPVPPSPETGDFTKQSAPAIQSADTGDDVDPIGEAELFLNFGRDAQAEEVLKEALSKNPTNLPVKLKLLSIYTNRKDAVSFSKYAREIQQTGDAAAWEQVVAMGRTVDPTNPTYGGGSGAQPEESTPAEPAPSVDFDLGFGKTVVNPPAAKEFSMDFDVTGTHPGIAVKSSGAHAADEVVDVSGILPGEVARAAQETPMDFDVSGILPGEVMKAAQKTEMDFDISSTQILRAPAAATMDFDVTGSGDALKASAAPAAPALDLGDLVFEMPTSGGSKAEEPAKPVSAGDGGMDFMIDFPMDVAAAEPAQKVETASKLDIDFADISLNLDTSASPAGGDAKSEQWHEVATKLDLAKAYQEMGDAAGAREILDEVVRDGDGQQRETAEKLLEQLSA